MELLSNTMDLTLKYLPVVLAVLGGMVVALAAIAPLTKSETDNKALAALRKLEAFLVKTVMPFLTTRQAAGASAEKSEVKAAEKAASKAGK